MVSSQTMGQHCEHPVKTLFPAMIGWYLALIWRRVCPWEFSQQNLLISAEHCGPKLYSHVPQWPDWPNSSFSQQTNQEKASFWASLGGHEKPVAWVFRDSFKGPLEFGRVQLSKWCMSPNSRCLLKATRNNYALKCPKIIAFWPAFLGQKNIFFILFNYFKFLSEIKYIFFNN